MEREDFTGQHFGYWEVLERAEDRCTPKGIRLPFWKCKCHCNICETSQSNIIKEVNQYSLKRGDSTSCGRDRSKMCHPNEYDFNQDIGIGYDYNGKEFYFDKRDYDKIKIYRWIIDDHGYVRTIRHNKKIYLHRFIMDCVDDNTYEIDHINHIRHDNRKSNLRFATRGENSRNSGIRKDNKSGIIGVFWDKRVGKWFVYIKNKDLNNKRVVVGWYNSFEEAVEARLNAEKEYYQEFSPQYDYN